MYALQDVDEASAYLRDPILRGYLLAAANAVRDRLIGERPPMLREFMGSEIDALKLVSSMTLFREVARRGGDDEIASAAAAILQAAQKQGMRECAFTLARVHEAG